MKRILAKDLASNVLQLPRLPIPSLEKSAENYRASIIPLKPADTTKAHLKKFDMFISSSGATLQKALIEADKAAEASGKYPFSFIESFWDHMYLSNRAPLLVNTNPSILIKKLKNAGETQASVAASLIHGIAKWVQDAVKNGVEVRDDKMDLSLFVRQFGASLIPGEKVDELYTTPFEELRHVIVLHQGYIHAVRVFDDHQVPLERVVIEKSIEYILSVVPETDNTAPVSLLTAGSRETWAGAYAELVKSPENAETLKKVREGIIVVCLDEEKWGTDDQLKNGAILHGNQEELENRWYDKHQVIISADCQVAFNFEHSGSDGMQWTRWIGDIINDIENSTPATTTTTQIDAAKASSFVQPLSVTFGKAFAGHIRSSRTEVLELISGTALDFLCLPFGKTQLKQLSVSPDSFVQMCFHVAFHKCRNKLAAGYESASTSRFFHGRTETIRSATQEMLALVEAINREPHNSAGQSETTQCKLVSLIKAASNKHVALCKAAANGEGFDRHLTALMKLAVERKDNPALNFFNDDVYKSCSRWLLSTSNLSHPWCERFSFGPVTPNGYGLGYIIDENEVRIMLSAFKHSPSTNVNDLRAAMEWASTRLHRLLVDAKN